MGCSLYALICSSFEGGKRLLVTSFFFSPSQCVQNGGNHVRLLRKKGGTGCQRSYLLVDGWEQRYEVVTSCDHLHWSHASYSDQTQMRRHNMILCDVLWICDKVYSASSVHGVLSGFVNR